MNNKKAINLSVTVIISEDVNSESRAARLGSTRLTQAHQDDVCTTDERGSLLETSAARSKQ